MSFATSSQKQSQEPQTKSQPKKKKHKSLNSLSGTTFPTSYITAQNCFSNFTKLQQELAQNELPIEETALMIKNFETTSVTTSSTTPLTDWDEKQKEENEACKVLERRSSVHEEFFAAQDITITETKICQTLISTECTDLYAPVATTSDIATTVVPAIEEIILDLPTNNIEEAPVSNQIISTSENLLTEFNSITCEADSSSKYELRRTPSPSDSPGRHRKNRSSTDSKDRISVSKLSLSAQGDEADTLSKNSDNLDQDKNKGSTRLSERAKKKSWYNVLYPNYKSRAEDFKKLFKEVPNDERLLVDYSCALQRDILVQGRLYVSQNYACFHANIFRWETYLCIKWKDVTSITKEKTALVIPNAISICTAKEKYFFATFATRDKAFLMLFRVWQNTLMNKPMLPQEMWQYVHDCYGEELGLTTDDEDYIDPSTVQADTEGEIDFSSAQEDAISLNSISQLTDFNTATSNSNIIFIGGNGSNSSSTGVSASMKGSGSTKIRKSYFFNTNKSSSASANATSGSDNKASDNNSGGDFKMIPSAKELALISAEPNESLANESGFAVVSVTTENLKNGSGNGSASLKEPKVTNSDGKRKVSKNTRQRDEALSKNVEAIPTDMSQSSDSEEDKIPFVVTAECNSTHEGRQLVHTILPINIDMLFNMLFSKSKFLCDFHEMRKSTDTTFGDWTTDEEGQKTRKVNLTVQLTSSVGPKTSKVTEYQVMRDCSKPGELYSIDINSVNAGIPYADSFSVLMHYCLVRTVDDHTMLSVHAQIKYKKSIWGMVKGFIEKNTWAGLEDFYTALLHALQSETCIPPAKGKGRRPRRGANAAQTRPIDENSAAALTQGKAESIEQSSVANPLYLPFVATKSQALGDIPSSKYRWLSWFVIVLLLFLIAVNIILLMKLWKLESRIEEDVINRARMPNLSSLKELPNSSQEWIELFRQQEMLHEAELRKWHKVLQTAIELLRKTEKTLAELLFR